MKNPQKSKISSYKTLRRLFISVFKAAPLPLLVCMLTSILHGLSWGLVVSAQQIFFDAAAGVINATRTFVQALNGLLFLAAAYIISQVLNGADNLFPSILDRKITGLLSIEIHKKIARLSPIAFENPQYLDDINKAEEGKENAVNFIWLCISICFFYLPYFLYMGWYLFSLKPVLVVSILIVFIPSALTQILRTKLFSNLEDASAPLRRQYDYYENCIVGREYFKENRLLGGFQYFKRLYMDTLTLLQKKKYKATVKSDLAELAMRSLSIIGYISIVYMLFDSLMAKEISIGAFTAVFNTIGLLFSIMEEVVCWRISDVAKNMGAVGNYLRFLQLEESKGYITISPASGDIELQQVSFRYPKTETPAVSNVSLHIRKGETVALVGENGSGKSTLVRLITGLYLPDTGVVLHNGVSTADLALNALYFSTSAVFQKYQHYQMSLRENIGISDTRRPIYESKIEDICDEAGVRLDTQTFPNGYDTMLSREFDGVDLSGGQWQRIAIARGLYRVHDFIVLDEPTAAIDPYEETRLYNRFAQIVKDKTAVIVTHRLGSVRLADRILVMKNGVLCQSGTHDELIQLPGEYRRLYQAQQQWYEENS